jgi:hypothetical protein
LVKRYGKQSPVSTHMMMIVVVGILKLEIFEIGGTSFTFPI